MLSKKAVATVLVEAFVVGIGLIMIQYVLFKFAFSQKWLSNLNFWKKDYIMFVFISGVIFHLGFEYTGVNMWYSKEYCKLL